MIQVHVGDHQSLNSLQRKFDLGLIAMLGIRSLKHSAIDEQRARIVNHQLMTGTRDTLQRPMMNNVHRHLPISI